MSEAALDLFVGVDLAARFSAAVCVDQNLDVVFETLVDTGPAEKPPNPIKHIKVTLEWWYTILEALKTSTTFQDAQVLFVVENVHHRAINYMPVARLQGALLGMMAMSGVDPILLTAIEWQRHFGYSKKEHGDSKTWAKAICAEFGYEPGCSLPEGTKLLTKPKTDLRDAYLLARWLKETLAGA